MPVDQSNTQNASNMAYWWGHEDISQNAQGLVKTRREQK
jgi:hypothetical protein